MDFDCNEFHCRLSRTSSDRTRKGIVEASTLTGQSSEGITKSVLSQVAGLKQATGISFNYQKILKEASNLGGYLGLSFSKYPSQLTKSLVAVKSMGIELKQLDSIADSFLDFESSISKEFEAQLLTGKDIYYESKILFKCFT